MIREWHDEQHRARVHSQDGVVYLLSIHRRDGQPERDWPALHRIKNELAGPDITAIEIYPPADEVVDFANAYHLWCCPPGFRMPVSLHPKAALAQFKATIAQHVEGMQRFADALKAPAKR